MKGPFGFGKTLAAASWALDGPVYMAYWDKKKPIELRNYFSRFGSKGQKILRNLEYDVYGASNAGQYLDKVIELTNKCSYSAVITDSVTTMTSGAVNWSLNYGKKKKSSVDVSSVLPGFDEYKVETSLITQALDLFRVMPTTVIWIAHPVPSIKVEGSGASMRVTTVNPIVAYGNKVGAIVPGNFSEIYHFTKSSAWDGAKGGAVTKYIVSMDAIGEEYAKSNIGLTGEIDVTDALFYEVWKDKVRKHQEALNDLIKQQQISEQAKPKEENPFSHLNQTQTTEPTKAKIWNHEKGRFE